MSAPSEGEILAQLGMDQAVNAADTRWLAMARWWIVQYANKGALFTADDLLTDLASIDVHTAENRALGGVIRTAHRDGLIAPTGAYIPSQRPQSHARPCRQWRGIPQRQEPT